MIGGEQSAVSHLDPLFKSIAPGRDGAPVTPTRDGTSSSTADHGYLYCGPSGAGHFVKMVHNGIEYGLMAAYAEGLNVLHGGFCMTDIPFIERLGDAFEAAIAQQQP